MLEHAAKDALPGGDHWKASNAGWVDSILGAGFTGLWLIAAPSILGYTPHAAAIVVGLPSRGFGLTEPGERSRGRARPATASTWIDKEVTWQAQ